MGKFGKWIAGGLGWALFGPIGGKCPRILWTNHKYFCIKFFKLRIILAQLRHMPPAKWSSKSPVKNQDYIFSSII